MMARRWPGTDSPASKRATATAVRSSHAATIPQNSALRATGVSFGHVRMANTASPAAAALGQTAGR
jgi:hypothetical protein